MLTQCLITYTMLMCIGLCMYTSVFDVCQVYTRVLHKNLNTECLCKRSMAAPVACAKRCVCFTLLVGKPLVGISRTTY